MIVDSEADEKYGIETWDGTLTCFYARWLDIEPYQIEIARQEYLNDFTDIPLAHKKERVRELIKLLNSIPEWITIMGKKGSGIEIFNQSGIAEKRQLLKEIRAEMGEEAWQKALENSGSNKHESLTAANLVEVLNDNNGHPQR